MHDMYEESCYSSENKNKLVQICFIKSSVIRFGLENLKRTQTDHEGQTYI